MGLEGLRPSYSMALSRDGRFAACVSLAGLTPNDGNTLYDIYLYDLVTGGGPELVSVNLSGVAGNLHTNGACRLSSDGRFVVFNSHATDLVPSDNNNAPDAFCRDRLLGVTTLESISSSGVQGDSMSYCCISDDGRYAAFSSSSGALVPGDTNGVHDVFVRDRQASTTGRISVSTGGAQGNSGSGVLEPIDMSPDGRFVSFTSGASNFFPGDSNGKVDVFVRDRLLGTTTIVSLGASGQVGSDNASNGSMSSDGRVIAFTSQAADLVSPDTNGTWDVFVRDLVANTTVRVSVNSLGIQGNDACDWPEVSPDGRYVAFISRASNLIAGDTNGTWDVFVHDRVTRSTSLLSLSSSGAPGNGMSYLPTITDDLRVVMFTSQASDLVAGDTNGVDDVFVRRASFPDFYCTAKTNSLGCVPAIDMRGIAAASFGEGATLSAAPLINQKLGLLLYTTAGSAGTPWHGGTMCIATPFHRTPPQSTGGSTSGSDCSGALSFSFNAWMANGVDPSLVAGRRVWAQFWSRDPGFPAPDGWSVTGAVSFEIDL